MIKAQQHFLIQDEGFFSLASLAFMIMTRYIVRVIRYVSLIVILAVTVVMMGNNSMSQQDDVG